MVFYPETGAVEKWAGFIPDDLAPDPNPIAAMIGKDMLFPELPVYRGVVARNLRVVKIRFQDDIIAFLSSDFNNAGKRKNPVVSQILAINQCRHFVLSGRESRLIIDNNAIIIN